MADQRAAIVTGANRGIGLEVVRQFAQRGYVVVLGSRDLTKCEAAAASIVWAVELPDNGPTGSFFRGGRPVPW